MRKYKYFQEGGEIAYEPGMVITDVADINTKRSLWNRIWNKSNDVRDMMNRGFVYQDENGKLVNSKEAHADWTEDQWRDYIKGRKQDELMERKYGGQNYSGWDENARAIRSAMVNSDSGRVRLTGPKTTGTPTNTTQTNPQNSAPSNNRYYKWSLTKSDQSPIYSQVFKHLYDNGKFDILDAMVDNGTITDKGLQNYLQQNFNGSFDDMMTNFRQNGSLTDAQYQSLGIKPKSTHPELAAPTAITDQSHWQDADKTAWNQYGINNQNRARAVQTALGLTPDNWLGQSTKTALNGKTFTDDNFHGDYYMFNDGKGNNYYAGANGKVYNSKGDEVQHSYQNGQHTISSTFKKGGTMKYFQQGGVINRQQAVRDTNAQQREALKAAFTAAASGDMETLSKVLGITTQDQLNQFVTIAQKISKQKDADPEMAELASRALNGIQQAMSVKAAKGTKLDYIKRLNGKCPDGYEMKMYKVGGKVCKKCQKIEEACMGKKLLKEGGESELVTKFKNRKK